MAPFHQKCLHQGPDGTSSGKRQVSSSKQINFKTVNIDGNPLQGTIPRREQVSEVLCIFRGQVGHPGMNATSIAIQKYYMWKGMHAEIVEYVKTCDICQQNASLPPQARKKLHPIPPPDHPLVHIGMDLVCDLPTTA